MGGPKLIDAAALERSVRSGDRRALARAITVIESSRADHRTVALDLLRRLAPHSGASIRVGISGSPGVGKSTFIEALGNRVVDSGHRLAVLSVDPSSALSGGSILGDKTRMLTLAKRAEAYIRPSPNRGVLGGVSARTRETMIVCEAAGFDVVFVETVGIGQSETSVAAMTDMFVLLLAPAGGDELQGMKRGILELADLILVNKADGELKALAQRAAADYRNSLRLLYPRSPNWTTPVELCSALHGVGIDEAWDTILHYRNTLSAKGEIIRRRGAQARDWMWPDMTENLGSELRKQPRIRRRLRELEIAVTEGRLPPPVASRELLNAILGAD